MYTTIMGGALIALLFGTITNPSSLRFALLLPMLSYACILCSGLRGIQHAAAD